MSTSGKFKLAGVALAMMGLAMVSQAVADEYHYRDILIGDRAAGLGGAFTAIADDASGLYYNPAGVVYSPIPRISGSVSAYNFRTTEYSNLNRANPNQTWTRTSSGMVANYFGVVQPLGTGTVGFSIAVPNFDLENQNDDFRGINGSEALANLINDKEPVLLNQSIDFNNEDSTVLFGPSYGMQLASNLSVGVTFYGYYRQRETTNWQRVYSQGSAGELEDIFYQKIQTRELGVQPRLGVMWSPQEKVSLGVMVQSTFILDQTPEERISSTTTFQRAGETHYSRVYLAPNEEGILEYKDISSLDAGDNNQMLSSPDNDLPTEINLGLAYFHSNDLLYSFDFSYATETDVYEATWNASAGAEYFLSPAWAVRGGVFTNNANTSSNVAQEGRDHVNLLGGAFSVSRYTPTSNITVGFNYSYGEGEANLNPATTFTQDIKVQSLSAYVSASASF